MQLEHLKYKSCPVCESRVVWEQQLSQHTNGRWFEDQKFHCGCRISYSPNLRKEYIDNPCPHSDEEIEKTEKRIAATNKIVKYIAKLDVDNRFRNELSLSVQNNIYIK